MNRKNEKGFALVLSLVLLMAMSLMGGALIVISASDHQSNNISDEYQQTFYVAETALFEGEKYLLNQFKGPYKTDGKRDISKRNLPPNNASVTNPPHSSVSACYNSFSDIDRPTFKAVYGPPPTNPTSTSKNVVYHEENESIKKDATDSGNDGMAYRIFGCGIFDNGKIIVPLESTMVLPQ